MTIGWSLCVHLKALFQRLPDAPEDVDFINIDGLAARIVGNRTVIDLKLLDEAFALACLETVPA